MHSIFDQYLTHFGGEIPKIVVNKILYSKIKIKKHWNPTNNHDNDKLFSSKNKKLYIYNVPREHKLGGHPND